MATIGLSETEQEAVARFERDVIQPSMTSLVVLQFTASWCGPCKQLSPVLDKVAGDYSAKGVRLVRIDVDQEKLIASQFRIQSVPTVYAFHQGQPVADLTNYRTEGQIARVLDQLLGQLHLEVEGSTPQAEIEPVGRPDLLDRRLRLVLEADSFGFHASRRALRRDCERYNGFALQGWTVYRFSWEHVMHRPGYVREVLVAAVRLAEERRPMRRALDVPPLPRPA